MTQHINFIYSKENYLVHSCGECGRCIKWDCTLSVPGNNHHCGLNSTCEEWIERQENKKISWWKSVLNKIIKRSK
jgi:hypothetical protein